MDPYKSLKAVVAFENTAQHFRFHLIPICFLGSLRPVIKFWDAHEADTVPIGSGFRSIIFR